MAMSQDILAENGCPPKTGTGERAPVVCTLQGLNQGSVAPPCWFLCPLRVKPRNNREWQSKREGGGWKIRPHNGREGWGMVWCSLQVANRVSPTLTPPWLCLNT